MGYLRALGLLVLTACSSFSSGGDSGGQPDAAVPAPDAGDAGVTGADGDVAPAGCVPRSTPIRFFEATFDGTPPQRFSVLGIASDLPPPGANVDMQIQGPSASAPYAMWITSRGGGYALEAPPRAIDQGVCGMRASFDLLLHQIGAPPPQATLATIGVRNPAWDHCYVNLELDASGPRLTFTSFCGKDATGTLIYAYKEVANPLPALNAFDHVDIDLDLGGGQATLTLGASTTRLPLPVDQIRVGGLEAYARFGYVGNTNLDGTAVALDTMTVDLR